MKLLIFLIVASLAQAVTIKRVRATGGDYAGTLAGLQGAVDECRTLNATDPCVVEVEAGAVISGPQCFLRLNAQTTATKLIVIRSSRISELPDGVRVTAADASKLAKIQNACTSSQAVVLVPPEITGSPGAKVASHYLLQGLDLHYSGEGRNAGGAVNIGYDPETAQKAKAYWQAPHTITVDRCWAHGNDAEAWVAASGNHANQHGMLLNGRNITVKNSRLSDNNMDNTDHGQAESHGILADNSPGPLYVYNNYIDGAIGSLLGGSDTWIPDLVLTGAWFYGNEYSRDPWAWHWLEWDTTDTLKTTEPCISGSFWEQKVSPLNKWKCVGGSWQATSDTRLNRGWTKNAWECKNCRMVFVEGNFVHDIPSTGDQSQYGFAFLLNNVDSSAGALQARPENVMIRYNRAQRTGQGPTTGWLGDTKSYKRINNVIIEHNIFESLGGARVSPTQGTELTSGGGMQLQTSGLDSNLRVAHNTFIYDRNFGGSGFRLTEELPIISNVYLRDNILSWAAAGQAPLNIFNPSCTAFRAVMTGAVYWDYLGLVDTNARGQTAFDSAYTGSDCPVNISRAATWADVKFVNFNNGEDGDYRLCTGSGTPHASCDGASPWATAASDGGPLGADALQVSRMTAGAKAGTYDPGLFEMKIVEANANQIRYSPYHPKGACAVTTTRLSNNTVTTNTDDAGFGNLTVRYLTPTIPAAGEYRARITCKDAGGTEKGWAERDFKVYQ